MDSMSDFDIHLVFTLPPRDSALQYKRCVHLWNNFPCITTLQIHIHDVSAPWSLYIYIWLSYEKSILIYDLPPPLPPGGTNHEMNAQMISKWRTCPALHAEQLLYFMLFVSIKIITVVFLFHNLIGPIVFSLKMRTKKKKLMPKPFFKEAMKFLKVFFSL